MILITLASLVAIPGLDFQGPPLPMALVIQVARINIIKSKRVRVR